MPLLEGFNAARNNFIIAGKSQRGFQLMKNNSRNTKKPLSVINNTIRNAIAKSIRDGAPIEIGARMAGVNKSTFNTWLTHGRELNDKFEADSKYPDTMSQYDWDCVKLCDAVDDAHADLINRLSTFVRRWAKKDPKVAMWLLERRDPKNFSHNMILKSLEMVKKDEKAGITEGAKIEFYVPDNGRLLTNGN